ncbi:hypothetical protein, partial [Streptomyces sp. NPDC059894]
RKPRLDPLRHTSILRANRTQKPRSYFSTAPWVVPYLTALAQGVEDARTGRPARVMFFDGPFWVDLRVKGDTVELAPGGGGADGPPCTVESVTLSSGVLEAGQRVVTTCEREGWIDDDVRALRSALLRLR